MNAAAEAEARRRRIRIIAGAAVILVLAIALGIWATTDGGAPRLNASTVTLAKFVASDQYLDLPFEKQEQYMRVLEGREDDDELDRTFLEGKIAEAEFRTALVEAWLGEQLKRTEKFHALSGNGRTAYVNELLDKKRKKKLGKSNRPEDEADAIRRDGAVEDMRIASWPADVRERWHAFRAAYAEQKLIRDQRAAVAENPPTQ